ncbi:MAG: hypothetical protein ACFFBD_16350, partial [Candidatus Hodarchaeota archaeon]
MSNQQFVRDFFDEFEKIKQILDPEKRALSQKQRSIILEQHLNSIIHIFNSLSRDKNLSVEEKSQIMEDALHKMSRLLLLGKGQNLVDDFSWYKLQMLRNFFITSLMDFWGEGGALRIVGMANALSTILMGIQVIDVKTLVVDKSHPEFFKRYTLAFNYLNHTASLFYNASCSLYTITKEHLVEWGTLAIEGNSKLLALIQQGWEIPKWYAREAQLADNSRFYRHFATMIATLSQMLRYIISLSSHFGNEWSEFPYSASFITTSTIEGFLGSIQGLLKQLEDYIEDFKRHVAKGTFDMNDKPLENPVVKQAFEGVDLIRLVVTGLSLSHSLIVNEDITIQEQMKALILEILSFLENRVNILEDPEFLGTEYIDYLAERLEYFICFIGIFNKYSPNWKILERLQDALGIFVTEDAQKRYPRLYGLFLVTKLTLAAKL